MCKRPNRPVSGTKRKWANRTKVCNLTYTRARMRFCNIALLGHDLKQKISLSRPVTLFVNLIFLSHRAKSGQRQGQERRLRQEMRYLLANVHGELAPSAPLPTRRRQASRFAQRPNEMLSGTRRIRSEVGDDCLYFCHLFRFVGFLCIYKK